MIKIAMNILNEMIFV